MNKIHNIAKNTSYLTLALVIQKVISFSYFTLLARYLGPADLGKYYFAISFTTIFAIFIDLGLTNVIIREVAKDNSKAGKLLANILGLKLPLALLSLLAAVIIINFSHPDPLVQALVYISCVSMVLDSFTATFFAVVRGFHNLKYESIASIVFQLIVLFVGYGALLLGYGLVAAMAALALASLYNFIYSFLVTGRRLKIKIGLAWDKALLKEVALIAWPFAVYAVFQRFYTYLDSVLLSFFAGDEQVGLYQVAFKIIFALQFLPLAFTASLYPALSAYWKHNREQLAVTFERALNYLAIISWPIIFGVVLLADKIVLLFKEGYEGAILPLRITIIALFFMFVNFPIGSLLNACDRQRRNTWNMAIVAIVSVLINLALIPRWQAVGASVAVLITNILMFFLGIIAINGIMAYSWRKNLVVFMKAIFASAAMGLLIFLGREYLNVFLLIILGAISYFSALYLLGGFKRADITSVFKSFRL